MEPTVSDPSVVAQMGMRVGIPDAGQVNALETLNIRGERSVTCKGAFDAHPSTGPLPAGAPAACEEFRKQPDALERAAELDAQYGAQSRSRRAADVLRRRRVQGSVTTRRTCARRRTTTSTSRWTCRPSIRRSSRSCAPRARSSTRSRVAHEFNGGPGDPGGAAKPERNMRAGGQHDSAWSGQPCNPYDTERVVARVERRLRRRDRRQPRDDRHLRAVGRVVPGPGVAQRHRADPDDEGHHARQRRHRQPMVQRPRRHPCAHARRRGAGARCRQGSRARATTIRAIRSRRCPEGADARASRTRASCRRRAPSRTARSRCRACASRSCASTWSSGRRTTRRSATRSTAEIKTVLRDQLGAELVETIDARLSRRSRRAEHRVHVRRCAVRDPAALHAGDLLAPRRERRAVLRRAGPRRDVVRLSAEAERARGAADRPAVSITNFANFAAVPCHGGLCSDFTLDIDRYLVDRGDARIKNWADWVANAKFRDDRVARRRRELDRRGTATPSRGKADRARAQLRRADGAARR